MVTFLFFLFYALLGWLPAIDHVVHVQEEEQVINVPEPEETLLDQGLCSLTYFFQVSNNFHIVPNLSPQVEIPFSFIV